MFLTDSEAWKVVLGDCIEGMATMPNKCLDLAVFSPPFPALFSYTSKNEDIGNSEDLAGNGKLHLGFFFRQLARIVKPGRVVMVHVMQIPRMKRTGGYGMHDFRGLNIRLGERAGLIYEYDWAVRKNPQAQAIRTKSRELQFVGLERDRAKSRGALPDYLIKFRAPGENAVPIRDDEEVFDDDGVLIETRDLYMTQVSRNSWIEWAECTWQVKETETLNIRGTKGEGDVRHICPLQLEVIERLIRLYTNPGELVFSPFAGIGSEGYVAVELGRRFFGFELKPEYHATACRNIAACERKSQIAETQSLFAGVADDPELNGVAADE